MFDTDRLHDDERLIGWRGVLAISIAMFFISMAGQSGFPVQRIAGSPDGGGNPPLLQVDEQVLFGGYIIENAGQVVEGVRYYSLGNPSTAYRDDGVMFVIYGEMEMREEKEKNVLGALSSRQNKISEGPQDRSTAYLLRFEGANEVRPIGSDRLPFRSNFFIGNDPADWAIDVPSFREVVYENLYEGIDLVYRPSPQGIKYEFSLSPGADPRAINLRYEGIEALEFRAGGMAVMTASGEIMDSTPFSYQEGGAEVRCEFTRRGSVSFGFDCPRWAGTSRLTIDPLIYSTFLGGSGWERGYSIKVDGNGCAFVTGQTQSANFPTTPGTHDTTRGGTDDAFVTKLTSNGGSLVYSTYIGGSGLDAGLSVALDDGGNAYIAGETVSSDFPTTSGAFSRTNHGKSEGFVTKLNPDGNTLVFSTFIGGADNDTWPTVAVDAAGDVYVAGITASIDFPVTPGAYDTSYNSGDTDAFLMKLNSAGSALIYSTFLGGSDADFAYSVAVDAAMNAYATGGACSADFPISPGAFDASLGGLCDAFVTKVNASGSSLDYSTFLGGSDYDVGLSVAVDSPGLASVTGSTVSQDFSATPGAFDSTFNGGRYDAFVTKLESDGRSLIFSTYFGGGNGEYGNAIALDSAGNAYITGETDSDDLPTTPGAFDGSYNGFMDAYAAELNDTGYLVNSTYFGGSGTEGQWNFLTVSPIGEVYMTGITNSTDFPITQGAFDSTADPNRDAYVAKIAPLLPDLALGQRDISFNPPGPEVNGTLVTISATIDNIGSVDAANVMVRFYDGLPAGSNQIGADSIIPLITGPGGSGIASVTWPAEPPGSHNICVSADPDDIIFEASESNNIACRLFTVLTAYTLPLAPGHRFISFPIRPVDDDIAAVLGSISGSYDYVRWYDALDASDHWKSYDPSRAYNDVTRLDNSMGFWIDVTAPCNLIVTGYPEAVKAISLRQGWNMVGYPSFNSSYTVADLKTAIGFASAMVETYDSNAAPYYLQRVPDSHVMTAGAGYWLFVPMDAFWIVYW